MGKENNNTRDPRRRLLKTIAAGGSAAGLAALPGKWAKPVVASVILPAHAQTSPGCLGTLANCPSGYSYSGSDSYGTNKSFSPEITNLFTGVTWDGENFDGSDSIQKYETGPPCSPPCDDVVSSKYLSITWNFEGTGASFGFTQEFRCGDQPFFSYTIGFVGDSEDGPGKYTGTFSYDIEACYYLDSILDRQRGRRSRRNFQF